MVPLSTVMDMRNITGPEYTTRFNEYRGIEIFALPAPGYSSGDAMNELSSIALDPNVHIGEYKALTCDVRPGRRPRGRALLELVDDYRRRAERS